MIRGEFLNKCRKVSDYLYRGGDLHKIREEFAADIREAEIDCIGGTPAAAGIPERESELEREMEVQGTKLAAALEEQKRLTNQIDELADQRDRLLTSLDLLREVQDDAIGGLCNTLRDVLGRIHGAQEIPF